MYQKMAVRLRNTTALHVKLEGFEFRSLPLMTLGICGVSFIPTPTTVFRQAYSTQSWSEFVVAIIG